MHSAESWHMRKANFLVLCTVLCKLLISVFVVTNVKGRIDKTHRFICKADGRTTAFPHQKYYKKNRQRWLWPPGHYHGRWLVFLE